MRLVSAALTLLAALTLEACEPAAEPADAPATGADAEAPAQAPMMPADAPPQEEAATPVAEGEAGSCLAEIGQAAADRLVARCVAVSPATRPPCNVANPCALIQDEIDRSCAMYGTGEAKPAECAA